MEVAGLVATAILVKRQSAYLSSAAAAMATMFALDAWFDVLTATAGSAWYESLAAALFGEIPIVILLAAIATHSANKPKRARLRRYRGYLCTYTVAKYTQ